MIPTEWITPSSGKEIQARSSLPYGRVDHLAIAKAATSTAERSIQVFGTFA